MDKAALEARRAYRRKWAKDHPELVRQQQERYWAKKAAGMARPEEPEPVKE